MQNLIKIYHVVQELLAILLTGNGRTLFIFNTSGANLCVFVVVLDSRMQHNIASRANVNFNLFLCFFIFFFY